jgi:hypothetical protein
MKMMKGQMMVHRLKKSLIQTVVQTLFQTKILWKVQILRSVAVQASATVIWIEFENESMISLSNL